MSTTTSARTFSEIIGRHNVDQVAYLVPNLEIAIAEWNEVLGPREWQTWTYSPSSVPRLSFRGHAGDYTMRIALTDDSPQIELIEPVAGPSIYHDWIARRGYGPHHVGRFVQGLDQLIEELHEAGFDPVQTGFGYGEDGDGGFAYYEIDADTVFELIEAPARRRPAVVLGGERSAHV